MFVYRISDLNYVVYLYIVSASVSNGHGSDGRSERGESCSYAAIPYACRNIIK